MVKNALVIVLAIVLVIALCYAVCLAIDLVVCGRRRGENGLAVCPLCGREVHGAVTQCASEHTYRHVVRCVCGLTYTSGPYGTAREAHIGGVARWNGRAGA